MQLASVFSRSQGAGSIFIALILAIYLARDRDSPIATTIADASLAGVLLCLVVCLIAWFGSAEDLDRRR